jgi:hypothetical protein
MKPRDIFKIIVATVGLVIFCLGIINLIAAVVRMIVTNPPLGNSGGVLAGIGAVEIVFGVLIMKGYPPLTDIAFPPERMPGQEQDQDIVQDEDSERARCVSCQAPITKGTKICPKCGYTQPV